MTLLAWLACRPGDPTPDAGSSTDEPVAETTGDSGIISWTTPETTTTPGPASLCLPDTTLTLPVPPVDPPPLKWLLGGGFAVCRGDTWDIDISAGGYSTMFDDGVTEYSVRVQGWDVRDGELVAEVDAELVDIIGQGTFHEFHDWHAQITDPRLTCADGDHVAFTLSGTYAGKPLEPAIVAQDGWDDSPVYFEGGRIGERVFDIWVRSEVSDEVWVWATFPRTLQLFGPFPLTRQEPVPGVDDAWPFVLDGELRSLLDLDDAVYIAIGCADGVPLGSDTHKP